MTSTITSSNASGVAEARSVSTSGGFTASSDASVDLQTRTSISGGSISRQTVIEGENLSVTHDGRFVTDVADPGITLVTRAGDAATFVNVAGAEILAAATAFMSGPGDETLRNRGEIAGVVTLGAGDDVFDGRVGVTRDAVLGGAGADRLAGGGGAETLRGGGGDDLLRGRGGDDRLIGGAGDDDLRGGSGRDRLVGGPGDDRLAGGGAGDVFRFGPGDGDDAIADFSDNLDRIDLSRFGLGGIAELRALGAETADGARLDLTGHGGGAIVLEGFALSALGAADVLL